MSFRSVPVATLVAALVFAPFAPAEDLGKLQGTLTTVSGTRVPGAEVELVSLDDGAAQRLRTDPNGAFEASLAPGSYTVELPKDYVLVRGPRTVKVTSGKIIQADIVVTNVEALPPAGESEVAATPGTPSHKGRITAIAVLSGALAGGLIYAASREDRKPPTASASR